MQDGDARQNRLIAQWRAGSKPNAQQPVRLHFCPDNRRAAFILTDHGDRSRTPIFRAIYFGHSDENHPDYGQRGFCGHGVALTQGTFWTGWDGYDYLGAPDFLALMKDAHAAGVEICPHNTSENYNLPPDETRADIARYKEHFGPIKSWIDHNYLASNLSQKGLDPTSPYYILPEIKAVGVRAAWSYYDVFTNPPVPRLDMLRPPALYKWASRLIHDLARKLRGQRIDMRRTKSLATYLAQRFIGPKFIGWLVFLRNPNRTTSQRLNAIAAAPLDILRYWYKRLSGALKPRFPLRWDEKNGLYWFDTVLLVHYSDSYTVDALDDLVDNCGIFIGHTYLGVAHPSPVARTYVEDGDAFAVNPKLDAFIANLGARKNKGDVWNPTLGAFSTHIDDLTSLDCSEEDGVFVVRNSGLNVVRGITLRALSGYAPAPDLSATTVERDGEIWISVDLCPGEVARIGPHQMIQDLRAQNAQRNNSQTGSVI